MFVENFEFNENIIVSIDQKQRECLICSLGDDDKVYKLSGLAYYYLKLREEKRDFSEILKELENIFDATSIEIEEEVSKINSELVKKDLIKK